MEHDAGHYPDFDVMAQSEHWDPHTRKIVGQRLGPAEWQSLTQAESVALHHIGRTLLDDDREEIINYVVHHFDTVLTSERGESQRKQGVPKAAVLIRDGIKALDHHCTLKYGCLFAALDAPSRCAILEQMDHGRLELMGTGAAIPARELFQKLLDTAVSAYYSHPAIWSEIGYAGPAYPRGYVRSERGLTDPWEAKRR